MSKKSTTGRREFIKKGTAAIAGSTVMTTLPSHLGAYVGGSDLIKIGLVGCGNRGAGAAVQALKAHKSAKLVAMGDTFRDRLDNSYTAILDNVSKEQVDVSEGNKFVGFEAYQQVIDRCDVVLLATPPPFRPMHFDAAVKAGKNVFMEKPLAVDVPGFHQIMETSKLADQKNLTVVVGLQYRYKKFVSIIAGTNQGWSYWRCRFHICVLQCRALRLYIHGRPGKLRWNIRCETGGILPGCGAVSWQDKPFTKLMS